MLGDDKNSGNNIRCGERGLNVRWRECERRTEKAKEGEWERLEWRMKGIKMVGKRMRERMWRKRERDDLKFKWSREDKTTQIDMGV